MTRDFCVICLCGTSFLFVFFGLIITLVTLFDSPSSPLFSVNLFDDDQTLMIPKPNNSIVPTNLTIHFDLKLQNENSAVGMHYPDPIKLTFSYFPNVSMMVILGEYKIDSFYQGNGKTKHVRDVVETNSSFPTVIEGTDMIVFRVDLVGLYRYKKAGSKRHKVVLGCVVGVNYTTSQKLVSGFIGMVPPGLDSQLEPPVYVDYPSF